MRSGNKLHHQRTAVITRWEHEEVLEAMQRRLGENPASHAQTLQDGRASVLALSRCEWEQLNSDEAIEEHLNRNGLERARLQSHPAMKIIGIKPLLAAGLRSRPGRELTLEAPTAGLRTIPERRLGGNQKTEGSDLLRNVVDRAGFRTAKAQSGRELATPPHVSIGFAISCR